MANSALSKINGLGGIYSGSGAGDTGELALDHALATDILGKLLREDLGYGCCGWSCVMDGALGAWQAPLTATGAESLIPNIHASVLPGSRL